MLSSRRDDGELVGCREAGARVQPARERPRQRHRGDDRDRAAAGADERDVRLGGERRHAADRAARRASRRAATGDAGSRLRSAARSPRATAAWKAGSRPSRSAALARAVARSSSKATRAALRPASSRSSALARDAPFGDLAKTPEGSRERQHGQRQERADQLELEASQHLALQFPLFAADNSSEESFRQEGGGS